ncbi:MAG: hypothetical protein BWY70_00160 [Bacteroidetes bacterium ADurb.Bin408]|nr:MAG: hypothetical protein BWY70_00160 [Bacteroidetes bacterium ADurb.Bin408]
MKNLLFTIIIAFFLLFNAKSQVVLDFNTHAPISGDKINFIEIPYFEPGTGGKDMVWDFSKITTLAKTVVSEQKRPDKDMVLKFDPKPNIQLTEDEKNLFFNLNNTVYEQVGAKTDKYELVYNQPLRRMKYPFMYQDYFNGDFSGLARYENDYNIDIKGHYTVEADAYGILILPGNIIKNVIRIKQYTHSTQVSMCSITDVDTYKYTWFCYDERYPLISVISTEQRHSYGENKLIQEAFVNDKVFSCNSDNMLTTLDDKNNAQFNYNVYPNPFKNEINISYQLNSHFNVTVGVYDVFGKRIKDIVLNENQEQGIYRYTFNAGEAGLNPGMYFIKFQFDDKVLIEKIMHSR